MYTSTILYSYTSHSDVYLAPSPLDPLYTLPCPLPLHFHFFCTIYGRILLPLIPLITIYHILWTLVASRLLTIPFHALPQPVPLPLIFAFLRLFMDAFFATIILPHQYTSPRMKFEGSIVPGNSIPAPYPCLSPWFRFFGVFMGAFLHIFLLYCIHICIYIIYISE